MQAADWEATWSAGGHVLHIGSSLGQLDGIPLEGVKAYLTGAKSVQQIIDMPYPAEDLAKVCAPRHMCKPWQQIDHERHASTEARRALEHETACLSASSDLVLHCSLPALQS